MIKISVIARIVTLIILGAFFYTTEASGQSWIWVKQPLPSASGEGDPLGEHCIAVDAAGNSYSTGDFLDSLAFTPDTVGTLSQGGSMYLVKYDPNGNVLWARQGVAPNPLQSAGFGSSVAIDRADNAYVTGYFSDLNFGPFALTGWGQVFLTKYDANGNVVWARQSTQITAPANPLVSQGLGNSATVDPFGNIYVTGYFSDSIAFGTDTLKGQSANTDAFIAKYNTNGTLLWVKQGVLMSSASGGNSSSITTDALGNAYITGNFTDTISFGAFTLRNTKGRQPQLFLVKYDANGNVLWAKQSINANAASNCAGNSISIDASGHLYIAGQFTDTIHLGQDTIRSKFQDAFLSQYDSNGNTIWTKQGVVYNRGAWQGYSVSCDTLSPGGAYMVITGSGTHTNNLKFGADTFNIPNTISLTILIHFDSAGNILCSSAFSENGEDDGDAFGTDRAAKNMYLCGDFGAARTIIGTDTIPTMNFGEAPYLAKWSGCCHGSPIKVLPADTSICLGYQINIAASGATNYAWSPASGLSCTSCQNPSASPTSTTLYTVKGKDINGCIDSGKMTLNIKPRPVASLTSSPACKDSSNGTATAVVNGGIQPYTYDWTPGNLTNAAVTELSAGTYTLVVTDDAGCISSPVTGTVTTSSECNAIGDSIFSLFIPNSFTPNGDGLNDIFEAVGTDVKSFDMSIFDRWGTLIFHSQSLDEGWNGTFKNSLCQEDGYVYSITAYDEQNNEHRYMGMVTILK